MAHPDANTIANLLDRPIAFQRSFVRLGCGITGSLMLSQAVYWSKRTSDDTGWFYKVQAEWEEETGLTRAEQETARSKLVKIGVLEEVKRGVPGRLFYRVDFEQLYALLIHSTPANKNAGIAHTGMRESRILASGNLAFLQAQTMQSICTENSSEITKETTQRESVSSFLNNSQPSEQPTAEQPSISKADQYPSATPMALALCNTLESFGIQASPINPQLVALVRQGATVALIEESAEIALKKGKGLAYAMAIARNKLAEATNSPSVPAPDKYAPTLPAGVVATVPSKKEIDPELAKIKAHNASVPPMTPERKKMINDIMAATRAKFTK